MSEKGLFKNLKDFLKLLKKMEKKGQEQALRKGKIEGEDYTIDYEYDIKLGLEGWKESKSKPRKEKRKKILHVPEERTGVETGEVKSSEEKLIDISDEEELIEVIESEDHIKVVAEVPGIEDEKDIDIDIVENSLHINVNTETADFESKIPLTEKEVKGIEDVSFTNNVLEIKLKRGVVEDGT